MNSVEVNGLMDQGGCRGCEMGLKSIKVTLPIFHGGSDPNGYL